MADFRQEPQQTRDPSYGNSQGTERAGLQQLAEAPTVKLSQTPDYKSNTTYGKIFEGIGDVLTVGVRGTDEAIKDHIRTDVRAGVENIRNQFGVAQAVADPGQPKVLGAMAAEGPVPVAVNRLGNRIDGLNAMYKNGELQDSYFWAKVEKEIQRVKSQYPGYTDYIDERSEKILGTNSANALRRSLLSDVDALNKKQQSMTDKWTTFEHQHGSQILEAMPDYYKRKSEGNPYSQLHTEQEVARVQSEDARLDRNKKKLGLASDVQGFDAVQAEKSLMDELDVTTRRSMDKAATAAGWTSFADGFAKIQAKVNAGQVPGPEDQKQARAAINQWKFNLQTEYNNIMSKPWSENDPQQRSYLNVIKDPNKVKQIYEGAQARIKMFEDALFDPDKGYLNLTATLNKATQDFDVQRLMAAHEIFRKVPALKQLMGNEGFAAVMNSSESGFMTDLMVALKATNLSNISTGTENTMQKAFERGKDFSQGPQYYNTLIKDMTTTVGLPNANPSIISNTAGALFNNNFNFLQAIAPNERANTYYRVVNEQVSAAIYKNREQDPSTWTNYKLWTVNNYAAVMKTELSSVKEAIEDKGTEIKFDPKTNYFYAVKTNDRFFRKDSILDNIFGTSYDKPIENLNKATDALRTVLSKDNENPAKTITDVLKKMQADTSLPKQPGLLEKLIKAVKDNTFGKGPLAPKKGEADAKSNFAEEDLHPSGSLEGFLGNPFKNARGNISDNPIYSIDVKSIPEGMSARDYIKLLKEQDKKK